MTKIVCDQLGPSAYHSEGLMSDNCHCHYTEVPKPWVLYCQAGERSKNAKGKVLSFIHGGQVGLRTLSSPQRTLHWPSQSRLSKLKFRLGTEHSEGAGRPMGGSNPQPCLC